MNETKAVEVQCREVEFVEVDKCVDHGEIQVSRDVLYDVVVGSK